MKSYIKIFRYINYYGLSRTIFKAYGREQKKTLYLYIRFYILIRRILCFSNKSISVGLIGCGQYGFSTISFYLAQQGIRVSMVHDINPFNIQRFVKIYGSQIVNPSQMFNCDRIYIASNHASHTPYALEFLKRGQWVHIEKPIAVNYEQLEQLKDFKERFQGTVGFNRPHSAYTKHVLRFFRKNVPVSLAFIITGHDLDTNHWYNDLNEGTRLSGNFSHWIDLALFYLNHIEDNSSWDLQISLLDDSIIDDNILVDIKTKLSSRITILFQTRGEPILGIQESHFYQQQGNSLIIKDYRSMETITTQVSERIRTRKDVGHKQMFYCEKSNQDAFFRAMETAEITLHIIDALKRGKRKFQIIRN